MAIKRIRVSTAENPEDSSERCENIAPTNKPNSTGDNVARNKNKDLDSIELNEARRSQELGQKNRAKYQETKEMSAGKNKTEDITNKGRSKQEMSDRKNVQDPEKSSYTEFGVHVSRCFYFF